MDERATPVPHAAPVVPAPSERGWGKLLLALAAFLFLPAAMRALVPIDQSTTLLVPAIAACALVGWWAGGRAFLAVAWVAIASLLVWRLGPTPTPFDNLARGWSLLLAGSFGLVCLFGPNRPLFGRSLVALGTTLVLATIMCLVGPVSLGDAAKIVADEFARRNVESMAALNRAIQTNASEWTAMTAKVPQLANMPAQMEGRLAEISNLGVAIFPALLALQSLAALALAWATYHRL